MGVIAIPLSMALAIASGVPPQHGLYTAIVAGIVIALTGGSRFNISGPTAAFVVILYPVTQQFGLSGLLMATLLSGIILVIMALSRLGRLIEYIPLPVTLGFTCGIGMNVVRPARISVLTVVLFCLSLKIFSNIFLPFILSFFAAVIRFPATGAC